MYELVVESENNLHTWPLIEDKIYRIGRKPECEIQVDDRYVSSEHAELSMNRSGPHLRLSGGSNPIVINGKRVESADLQPGSKFSIGNAVFLLRERASSGDSGEAGRITLIDTRAVLSNPPTLTHDSKMSSEREEAEPAGRSKSDGADSFDHSVRLLETLSRLVATANDREALGRGILSFACARLDATRALLARVKGKQQVDICAVHGLPKQTGLSDLISTRILKKILNEHQAVLIGDTAQAGWDQPAASIQRNRIQAVACTPVMGSDGALEAVLYVDNQDRPTTFTSHDAEFLIWIGHVYRLLAENLEMRARLEAEVVELKRNTLQETRMVAEAPAMLKLLEKGEKAAASDLNVLILGESGTGKECLARFIHQKSTRAQSPFVACNCAAVPESMFESEMFGHERGAFTGAVAKHTGAFREAQEGTLFLDEIGDLSPGLQTKLLRAIQEKTVRPVGHQKDIQVNVRFICATNIDLKAAIAEGTFREDLFFRIGTIVLTMPPLRERKQDIVPLARHFTRSFSGDARTLSPGAEAALMEHAWPGNVRELQACVTAAVVFAVGHEIQAYELNLPSQVDIPVDLSRTEPVTLEDAERTHILKILELVNGNKTEAAKRLKIARSTLVLKLKGYQKLGY